MKRAANLLREDHEQIRRATAVLRHMAAASEKGMLERADADSIVGFLRVFSDAHHMGKEENVLFPALLRGGAQRNHSRLSAFIFEHNRERSLVNGLEEAVHSGQRQDFAHYASRLAEAMWSHVEKEAPELLALVDSTLTFGEDEALASELRHYDRPRGEALLPGVLKKLEEMELRYGYGRTHADSTENN